MSAHFVVTIILRCFADYAEEMYQNSRAARAARAARLFFLFKPKIFLLCGVVTVVAIFVS